MAILIAIVLFAGVFVLHRLGVLKRVAPNWDLFWRMLLNVLVAFGVLTVLVKGWSIGVVVGHLDKRLLISPSRDPAIDIASTVVLVVALIGVARRRKWGAWLVLARLAFTVALQLFVYHSLNWALVRGYTGSDNVIADLVGAAVWILAFNRTWRHFR